MSAGASVFLGLGANLGEREAAIAQALERLAGRGFRATRRSSLYLTEPVGGPPQGWFVNAVAQGESTLPAEELLDACLAVEAELGRRRGPANGPRTIDLDLLLFGAERRSGPRLTLPHPRLHLRRFVLVPLAELAPELRHPLLGLTLAELLGRCPDDSRVLPLQPEPAR